MNLRTREPIEAPPSLTPTRTYPRPLILCHERTEAGMCLDEAIIVCADRGIALCLRHALGREYGQWSAHRIARLAAWAREDFGI